MILKNRCRYSIWIRVRSCHPDALFSVASSLMAEDLDQDKLVWRYECCPFPVVWHTLASFKPMLVTSRKIKFNLEMITFSHIHPVRSILPP